MRIGITAALLVALLSACGGGSSGDTASCTTTAMRSGSTYHSCTEWSGLSSDELITVRTLCNASADASITAGDGGVTFTSTNAFVAGPCDHTGAIGGCKVTDPPTAHLGTSTTTWIYDDPLVTREALEQSCTSTFHGVFVEP